MIRVFARTRRRGEISCCSCRTDIVAGDRYRELLAVQESDIFDKPFKRLVAHECCVADQAAWEVTTRTVLQERASRSLDGVRHLYGLNIRPGQACVANGEEGVITGGDGKYLCVRLKGLRHAANFHVRDVELAGAES